MIDLVCLAADKNIEAALAGILRRSSSLGIREVEHETIVHPHRDPGCFHQSGELLRGFRSRGTHALVVLDRAWDGAPPVTGAELEARLEASLDLRDWARAVVIEPELEAWVWSDSPHVARSLGWREGMAALRGALVAQNLWHPESGKPRDPKAAVEWVLRNTRTPRSSSIFRELALSVSLARCEDRAFLRLKGLLVSWLGSAASAS